MQDDKRGLPAATRPAPGAIAAALAGFAASTGDGAVPAAIRSRALHHILDAVGLAFAVAREDHARKALAGLAAVAAPGAVPVLAFPYRLSPRDAAIANGLLCHSLDFDDTHMAGIVHPTVAQFPAALSAAVMAGTSVGAMLTSYVVGVEAAARIAATARGGFHRAGFHPTGVCNAPAAALAAGRLLGLEVEQLRHAQGIALSMASGTLEFLADGAWTKRLHPGWAASSGIVAAAMAREGFVGPGDPYSGRFGLYRAFLGGDEGCDYVLATAGLGTEWELLRTAIKPYPACHLAHGCIEAALALAASGRFHAGGIVSVEALVHADMAPTICEPLEPKQRPRTPYEAQFSIPWLVAAALTDGRVTLATLAPERLADPALLSLAARVGWKADPGSGYPRHYSGEVRVTLADGRCYTERRQINAGAPDLPVPDAAIVEKFEANAGLALAPPRVKALRDLVLSADGDRPAADWAEELAGFC